MKNTLSALFISKTEYPHHRWMKVQLWWGFRFTVNRSSGTGYLAQGILQSISVCMVKDIISISKQQPTCSFDYFTLVNVLFLMP